MLLQTYQQNKSLFRANNLSKHIDNSKDSFYNSRDESKKIVWILKRVSY